MRNQSVKSLATGGMFSALGVGIMCMGTLIPLATFLCPVFVILIGYVVFWACGRKIAWCWYGAVSVLSALLASDKEAAAVFLFIGYYPILKPWFDKLRFGWVGKLFLFNAAIGILYYLILQVFGMAELAEEYALLGFWGGAVMWILGNVTFFLVDKLLTILARKLN